MLDEDFLKRPPAPRPYMAGPAVLHIPPSAVVATRSLLQRAGRKEACVFWFGEKNGEASVVKSVRAPEQRCMPGNYHVEVEWMSNMVRNMPAGWRPLAQIHSHPGVNTEHSRYDDKMISSRKILSLVFPTYGVPSAPWPRGVGIHEWQSDYWHMLAPVYADRRIKLMDDCSIEVKDFRR